MNLQGLKFKFSPVSFQSPTRFNCQVDSYKFSWLAIICSTGGRLTHVVSTAQMQGCCGLYGYACCSYACQLMTGFSRQSSVTC